MQGKQGITTLIRYPVNWGIPNTKHQKREEDALNEGVTLPCRKKGMKTRITLPIPCVHKQKKCYISKFSSAFATSSSFNAKHTSSGWINSFSIVSNYISPSLPAITFVDGGTILRMPTLARDATTA